MPRDQRHFRQACPSSENSFMDINATVLVEELDTQGRVWRAHSSHMVRTNVERSLNAIRGGYNMERTRIKVDGQVVIEPRHR
ncbi:MAG: hypothetical protein QFC55_09140 [Chloroflexota bacterium]|nr:hypothetical protein [Chloroflexota bacterium]